MSQRVRPSTTRRGGRAVLALAGAAAAAWLSLAVLAPVERAEGAVAIAGPRLTSTLAACTALAIAAVVATGGTAALLPFAALLGPILLAGIPAAWIYAGPGAALVWATVVALAWRKAWPSGALPGTLRDTPWLPVLLGILWLGASALAVERVAMRGDAPHYLTIAQSLVADGDFDLRNDYDARTYRGFYAGQLEPRHAVAAPTGEEYSFHGIGVALLVAPAYWWLGARGATLTLVLILAAGSGLLWAAARRLTGNTGAAWFAWAALVLSAPYTLHAAAIYPDGPAAVGVCAALWLVLRLAEPPPVSLGALVLASSGLATLPWLHVRLALPAAIFGAAVVAAIVWQQPGRWTRVLWFLVVPVVSCAGWLASSYVMFGTWNPAATMLQRTAPGPWTTAPSGIFGMLMDQEFGLLPVAPVFIGAPFALRHLLRIAPLLAVSTATAAAGVLLTSSLWVWWGGDSAPARFLTVVLPVLALWLGDLWARSGAGTRRALGIGLAWSAVMTALLVLVDDGSHAYNYPDGTSSIFSVLSSAVDVAAALPSMFRPGASLASELPLALVWAGALVPAVWFVVTQAGSPARDGLVALALTLATSVAVGVAWRMRGVEGWTVGVAQQRLLAQVPSEDVIGFAISTRRGLLPADPSTLLRLRTPESVARAAGVLLYVPNVPAGRYAVHATPGRDDGELSLELGRDAEAYARWRASTAAPVIALAASVHSVRVIGPPEAASDVWLAPLAVGHSGTGPVARRVTRLADLDVYSMDDDTHVEGGGLWTGGDRSTSLIVASEPARLVTLRFEGGPTRVSVAVDAGAVHRTVEVDAHATGRLALGSVISATPLVVRLNIQGGFPASQIHPGDRRTLGVWVTFDSTAAP